MRILCRHGHFAFYPKDEIDISRFGNIFEEEFIRVNDFYTFAFLEDVPNYSLIGKTFMGLPATVTFEGNSWDVMKENGFVYNVALKLVVPKTTIGTVITLEPSDDFFTIENPLIQPGSRNTQGQQLMSYDAQFIRSSSQLRVTEVQYV